MLATYVGAWRDASERIIGLCDGLAPGDWSRPTDLPGWTVHDVVAHLADLESQLAAGGLTGPRTGTGRGEVTSEWTGPGVQARRDRSSEAVLREFADAVGSRAGGLAQDPPTDLSARPPGIPPALDWDWETLLRRRVVDVWVHEQDIRRAVGSPGGMGSAGAEVTVRMFAAALPYVLGKRVGPPAGTRVAWEVVGEVPLDVRLMVGDDGRARADEAGSGADRTRLRMDTGTFAVLAAGRRETDQVRLDVEGDLELGTRVAAAMAVTP